MLRRLIKRHLGEKEKQKEPIYAEDIIYNTNRVYILYGIVQNNFNYCMKNRLLKRKDILGFKFMLNKFVDQNDYRHETFKNDAHEIYRKLKSTSISKKQMLMLNEFLQPFIIAKIQRPVNEPIKKYGKLLVVK